LRLLLSVNELHLKKGIPGLKMALYRENKFGSYLKSRTFALPFEKRVADEAESSLYD